MYTLLHAFSHTHCLTVFTMHQITRFFFFRRLRARFVNGSDEEEDDVAAPEVVTQVLEDGVDEEDELENEREDERQQMSEKRNSETLDEDSYAIAGVIGSYIFVIKSSCFTCKYMYQRTLR